MVGSHPSAPTRSSRRLLSTAEAVNPERFTGTDWTLLGGAAAMFGSSFLFMAEALESLPPAVVTSIRLLAGLVVLSLFPSSRRPIDREAWPRIVLLAVVWFAAPLSLFPLAQQYISSSMAGMLNGATPVMVALVASLLLGRRPGRAQLAGIGLGAVGIALIAVPRLDGGQEAAGIVLGLGAVCCYGIAFNAAVPLQQRYGAAPVLWRALAVGCVVTAPIGLGGLSSSSWRPGALVAAVAVGVLGTGLAYVATATLSGRVGGTRSAVVTYVGTPISVLLGVALRGEEVALTSLVGVAAALGGAYLAGAADRGRGGQGR